MIKKAFEVLEFLKDVYTKRSLIIGLAKKDFMTQYIDSVFGLFWAFVHPLVLLVILWFIFSVGFKIMPVKNVPFVVWLTAGLAPWFFFADSFAGNTGIIVQNSFLVKKVVFRVSILPIARTLTSGIIHLIFLCLLIILLLFNGMYFSIWWFQVFYYSFSLVVLIIGVGWLTSSLNVFIKDISQLVNIVLQFGFWATPIFWDINIIPEKYHILFWLNPMYYIVQGYRESLIYHYPFWVHWKLSLYFWSVTIFILLLGIITFKKLRPHFADVL